MALANDVTHFLTKKGRHPKVSKITTKNLGAHFKGQIKVRLLLLSPRLDAEALPPLSRLNNINYNHSAFLLYRWMAGLFKYFRRESQ